MSWLRSWIQIRRLRKGRKDRLHHERGTSDRHPENVRQKIRLISYFDHLFGVLAPDDKVKVSPYWEPKDDNETNQVTRAERIEYAANTHIRNKTASERLIASTKHMLEVYNTLNKAHKRGKLDRSQSRESLKEMQSIIEDWVQSLMLNE